jgi:hypothetical protein
MRLSSGESAVNIEQMIRVANHGASLETLDHDAARRFAALVAEECAKVCDLEASGEGELGGEPQTDAARICARNIRDAFRQ